MTYFVVQQELWIVWMLKEAEKIIRRSVAEGDPEQLFCSGFVTKTSQIAQERQLQTSHPGLNGVILSKPTFSVS